MSTLNFNTQQCERIRRHFDAYLSNELLVETTGEVLRHLEVCEACAQELEIRVRMRDALRRAVRREAPPDAVVQAIHQRLRETQPRMRNRIHAPIWALAAACLVVALLAGVVGDGWLGVQRDRRMVTGVLSLGVSDHLICAIQNHRYLDEGRPTVQLRERVGPAYAMLVDFVQQRIPGFQVLEAHQCNPIRQREYVHFIASGQGTILSVILTKRNGESLPAGKSLVADTSNGINLYKAQLDGMNVAGFQANDYFGFVVSDVGQYEVLNLAAGLAPAMRAALPSITALLDEQAPEIEEASLSSIR